MAWSRSTRIQRPRAWVTIGVYRELARRLPRCGGSRRWLLALIERRNKGMQDYGVLKEEALAFTSWRGPLGSR